MTVRFDNVNSSRCIGYIYKNTSIYTLDEMNGVIVEVVQIYLQKLCSNRYEWIIFNYVDRKCYHDKGFAINTNPVNEAINFLDIN